MPYDEGLAERLRGLLDEHPGLGEKKMFGGLAFLLDGHMAVGIVKDELMVRVGPEAHDAALGEPHARPMDFTGRPMKGFVFVAPAGFEEDDDLSRWVERGVRFAAAQPRKPQRGRSSKRRNGPRSTAS